MRRVELRGRFKGSKLSAAARFVYVMLDAHADKAGQAWPSVDTLAALTGFGTTTVRAALRELEMYGEIVGRARKGQTTMYTLAYSPQRLALPYPNGIRPRPQRNTAATPTPGVAEGFKSKAFKASPRDRVAENDNGEPLIPRDELKRRRRTALEGNHCE